ncbi:MAG: hypothetical protein LDL41_01915 [Coleofasciculus sp. S288]|nr:hypothetical protein [Coleofasciculus sp. S288]
MELIAIFVLGFSAFLSFSTSERRSKPKTNRHQDDADWAFTEACDIELSKQED